MEKHTGAKTKLELEHIKSDERKRKGRDTKKQIKFRECIPEPKEPKIASWLPVMMCDDESPGF
jgi:hypothetical protein